MNSAGDRLNGLSRFAEQVSTSVCVDDLLARTAESALSVVASDAVSIGRLERAHAHIRVLHNAGELADWEQAWPVDETYPLSDHPQFMQTVGGARRWCVRSVDDEDTAVSERRLLESVGKRHAASFQVLVADEIWGDVYVSRGDDRPFDESDVAAGLTLTGLLSAGLSRLELLTEMSRLAYTDALTGLANRRAADDWLETRLAAVEPFPPVSVVLCDINGLKPVNDAYGHAAGDELIKLVSTHLITVAGEHPGTLVARIGGDEFLVLLEGVPQEEVQRVVERLAAADMPHDSGIAVGAATTMLRPAGAESSKTAARALMRLADAAQYRHKRTRRLSTDMMTGAALPVPVLLPAGQSDLTDRVLCALRDDPDRSVERRLALVGEAVSIAFDAASWWISREAGDAVVDVLGHVLRIDRQGLVSLDLVSGHEFDVEHYPATEAAMDGGGYYASLTEGDQAERALIARMGYVMALGAGDVDCRGGRWLMEIFGDAKTSSGLFAALPLLRALAHLAITGARP